MFVHILTLTSTNVINRNVNPPDKQTHLFRLNDTLPIPKTVYIIIKSFICIILYYIYYKLFMFSFDFY